MGATYCRPRECYHTTAATQNKPNSSTGKRHQAYSYFVRAKRAATSNFNNVVWDGSPAAGTSLLSLYAFITLSGVSHEDKLKSAPRGAPGMALPLVTRVNDRQFYQGNSRRF